MNFCFVIAWLCRLQRARLVSKNEREQHTCIDGQYPMRQPLARVHDKPMLTADMKRVVREQQLGFVATVNTDGTPNVSPKATFVVLDDTTIGFGDITSPGTLRNLKSNPEVEVNFGDPFVRKVYRFAVTATSVDA